MTPGTPLHSKQPVIVVLAVNVSVPRETGQFRVQAQFTLAALEAMAVPLTVYGQKVVAVDYLSPAAGTEGRFAAGIPVDDGHAFGQAIAAAQVGKSARRRGTRRGAGGILWPAVVVVAVVGICTCTATATTAATTTDRHHYGYCRGGGELEMRSGQFGKITNKIFL